jgi:cellulose synthase/poly-beta-1,6-N-acetylglucosamine synthase-like glycosyltransferase
MMHKRELAAPEVLPGRLAVLIAAHNEEAVLGANLQALWSSRYPRGAFDIFVVADNCKDNTAAVARAYGARVYERFSAGPSTKGQALSWLWRQLSRAEYAGVVVLDADNQVDPGFLGAIASELGHGYPAVQGIRRAKNAEGAGTAGLDALTELCTHRIGAAGRRALGINGPLMGSGVGYQAALFDRLISDVGETVVEDCEWQAKLALERTAIAWTDRAVVFDEKTSRAEAMQTQRNRWMAGRGQVARAYLRPLLLAGLKGNRDALDMAAFLLTVPRVLALAGFGCFFLLALALPKLPGILPAWVWFACLTGFALYVIAGLALDGAPASAYWVLVRGTLQLPRFALQMARATWKALSGSAVKWVPTPHGR